VFEICASPSDVDRTTITIHLLPLSTVRGPVLASSPCTSPHAPPHTAPPPLRASILSFLLPRRRGKRCRPSFAFLLLFVTLGLLSRPNTFRRHHPWASPCTIQKQHQPAHDGSKSQLTPTAHMSMLHKLLRAYLNHKKHIVELKKKSRHKLCVERDTIFPHKQN
jgi:hypothetical protein